MCRVLKYVLLYATRFTHCIILEKIIHSNGREKAIQMINFQYSFIMIRPALHYLNNTSWMNEYLVSPVPGRRKVKFVFFDRFPPKVIYLHVGLRRIQLCLSIFRMLKFIDFKYGIDLICIIAHVRKGYMQIEQGYQNYSHGNIQSSDYCQFTMVKYSPTYALEMKSSPNTGKICDVTQGTKLALMSR